MSSPDMRAMQRRIDSLERGLVQRPISMSSGRNASKFWRLLSGVAIPPAGVLGAQCFKGIDLTTLTLPEITDLVAPVGMSAGMGVATNIETMAYALVYNGQGNLNCDILIGDVFLSYATRAIKITSSSPDRFQSFLIPEALV